MGHLERLQNGAKGRFFQGQSVQALLGRFCHVLRHCWLHSLLLASGSGHCDGLLERSLHSLRPALRVIRCVQGGDRGGLLRCGCGVVTGVVSTHSVVGEGETNSLLLLEGEEEEEDDLTEKVKLNIRRRRREGAVQNTLCLVRFARAILEDTRHMVLPGLEDQDLLT